MNRFLFLLERLVFVGCGVRLRITPRWKRGSLHRLEGRVPALGGPRWKLGSLHRLYERAPFLGDSRWMRDSLGCLGGRVPTRLMFGFFFAGLLSVSAVAQPRLAGGEAINGFETLKAFEAAKAVLAKSAVRVEVNEELVAWGVVIAPDKVLTKLSEVNTRDVEFVLPGGERMTPFERMDVATRNDLALFELPGYELTPVEWASATNFPQGAWLISPGDWKAGIRVGICAAQTRPVERQGGVIGVQFGAPGEDGGIKVGKVVPDGGAYEAGIRPGDYLVELEGDETDSLAAAQKAIAKHEAGTVVSAKLLRDGEEIEKEITLGRRDTVYKMFNKIVSFSGETSRRKTGFEAVLQHDIPLPADEQGGPVLNLEGKAIGLAIARLNRSEGFALTSEVVQAFLSRKPGEPLEPLPGEEGSEPPETLSSEVAKPVKPKKTYKRGEPRVEDPMLDYTGEVIPPYSPDDEETDEDAGEEEE